MNPITQMKLLKSLRISLITPIQDNSQDEPYQPNKTFKKFQDDNHYPNLRQVPGWTQSPQFETFF